MMTREPSMRVRSEGPERASLLSNPVAIVDRTNYEALVAERDLLSSAHARQRIRATIVACVFAIAAAFAGFAGGFSASQRLNDTSFKMLCSRVLNTVIQSRGPQRKTPLPVKSVSRHSDRRASR